MSESYGQGLATHTDPASHVDSHDSYSDRNEGRDTPMTAGAGAMNPGGAHHSPGRQEPSTAGTLSGVTRRADARLKPGR
jgi:hypothetical protein